MNDKTTPIKIDIGYFKTENNILSLDFYLMNDNAPYYYGKYQGQ